MYISIQRYVKEQHGERENPFRAGIFFLQLNYSHVINAILLSAEIGIFRKI